MTLLYKRLALLAIIGLSVFGSAWAEPWSSDISGMAALSDGGGFVTVVDTKTGPEPPWTPRVGVLKVSEAGVLSYQPFAISNWGPGEELPNDLEACCAVPGRVNEFLIAESGYYKGRFGRVFHIKVALVPGSEFYAGTVLGAFKPVEKPTLDFTTPGSEQIEGMACLKNGERLTLVLGKRGGKGEPGRLLWGELNLAALEFHAAGNAVLPTRPEENNMRGCADLLMVDRGGRQTLLRVAASDPGDFGPFASFVCEAGEFVSDSGGSRFVPSQKQTLWWDFDGLKVESLATCRLGTAKYCIGSDDEIFGGVWRPLPAPRCQSKMDRK